MVEILNGEREGNEMRRERGLNEVLMCEVRMCMGGGMEERSRGMWEVS